MDKLDRITSLVRLLGTDSPTEQVNALCALERTLKAVGGDFNDLASMIEAGAPLVNIEAKGTAVDMDPIHGVTWQQEIATLQAAKGRLPLKEMSFVATLAEFPPVGAKPSSKQLKYLSAIYARFKSGSYRSAA